MEQARRQSASFAASRMAEETLTCATEADALVTIEEKSKRALLVEATTSSLRLCRDILKHSGFTIEAAGSGITALMAARERRPDLIVMDLQLPDVPGREFIGWLRGIPALQSTPIIVLAGASADSANTAHLGPNVVLRRPVSALVIHRAIRETVKSN